MQYFHDVFRDALAEDVATMTFQLWVLATSTLSVMHNSIPHLVVSIASYSLGTGWAGYRIKGIQDLRREYEQHTVQRACDGVDVLGKWWDIRLSHTIPLFAENALALIPILVTGIILYKRFMGIMFDAVGTSPTINKLHKCVLVFSASLQLSTLFTAVAAGIWIDRVFRGAFRRSPTYAVIYQAVVVIVAVAIIPWHLAGNFSIKRELPLGFIVFIIIHAFILALWPSIFGTSDYTYAFEAWPFFAYASVTSFAFLITTTVAAIACRLNFGKGLSHFLAARDALTQVNLEPAYHGAKGVPVEVNHRITYPEKTYLFQSHDEWPPELKYDSYSGGYTRGPTAASQHKNGFLRKVERTGFLCCVGSRKDRAGRIRKDYGPDARRLSQLGEPQFKLPMRPSSRPVWGKRGNETPSVLTESTAVTQGFVVGRGGGSNALGSGEGMWGLVGTLAGERSDQRTPLTTYVVPHHWKTKEYR